MLFTLPNLSNEDRHEITRCGSPGRSAQASDSDDESVTYPSSPPPFSQTELGMVQYVFNELQMAYLAATEIGYYNCTGKHFFQHLLKFAKCCSGMDITWHL